MRARVRFGGLALAGVLLAGALVMIHCAPKVDLRPSEDVAVEAGSEDADAREDAADGSGVSVPGGIFRCENGSWQRRSATGDYQTEGDCAARTTYCAPIPGHTATPPPLLRWTGTDFGSGSACLPIFVAGVAGASTGDVWLAGEDGIDANTSVGVVYRWDGLSWTEVVRDPRLLVEGIWVGEDGQVWAYGADAPVNAGSVRILRWSGGRWNDVSPSPAPRGRILAMHGAGADGPWAVGVRDSVTGPLILRGNGRGWQTYAAPSGTSFVGSVWSASPNDAWATTSNALLRWSGGAWTTAPLDAALAPRVEGAPLAGFSPDDVWVGTGLHWNGVAWSAPDPTERAFQSFFRIGEGWFALTARSCWGRTTTLWRWDGSVWIESTDALGTRLSTLPLPMGRALPRGPNDVWLVEAVHGGC